MVHLGKEKLWFDFQKPQALVYETDIYFKTQISVYYGDHKHEIKCSELIVFLVHVLRVLKSINQSIWGRQECALPCLGSWLWELVWFLPGPMD